MIDQRVSWVALYNGHNLRLFPGKPTNGLRNPLKSFPAESNTENRQFIDCHGIVKNPIQLLAMIDAHPWKRLLASIASATGRCIQTNLVVFL